MVTGEESLESYVRIQSALFEPVRIAFGAEEAEV